MRCSFRKILVRWIGQIFRMLTDSCRASQPSRKVFKLWEASRSRVLNASEFSKIQVFAWELAFCRQHQIFPIFLVMSSSLCSFPRAVCQIPQVWITIVWQLFFQVKIPSHGKVAGSYTAHFIPKAAAALGEPSRAVPQPLPCHVITQSIFKTVFKGRNWTELVCAECGVQCAVCSLQPCLGSCWSSCSFSLPASPLPGQMSAW